MHNAIHLQFGAALVIALAWDVWLPVLKVGQRRVGSRRVIFSLLVSSAVLILSILSAPAEILTLGLICGLLSCIAPFQVVLRHTQEMHEKSTKPQMSEPPAEYELPSSLLHADNLLKVEYERMMDIFNSSSSGFDSQTLVESGKNLAEKLSLAAMELGYSKAFEMSNEIPALTYWTAQLAQQCFHANDPRLQEYERRLHYYENFQSTAWLWNNYKNSGK